jgi:hypothetical protein
MVLFGAAAVASPLAAGAQQPVRVRRIGRLAARATGPFAAFARRSVMSKDATSWSRLGSIGAGSIRCRSSPPSSSDLRPMSSSPPARRRCCGRCRAATSSIPIVMLAVDYDPVALGLDYPDSLS